jgi:hypothetical protein
MCGGSRETEAFEYRENAYAHTTQTRGSYVNHAMRKQRKAFLAREYHLRGAWPWLAIGRVAGLRRPMRGFRGSRRQ